VPRFTVNYGPLRTYPPYAGVCYTVGPEERFTELLTALEACRVFESLPPRGYPFSPHMTVAQFITLEQTTELIGNLVGNVPEGVFECAEVTYAVPDEAFHFTAWASFPLG